MAGTCDTGAENFCVDSITHENSASMLYCPEDFENCEEQGYQISIFSKDHNISRTIPDSQTVCPYKFQVLTGLYDKVRITFSKSNSQNLKC